MTRYCRVLFGIGMGVVAAASCGSHRVMAISTTAPATRDAAPEALELMLATLLNRANSVLMEGMPPTATPAQAKIIYEDKKGAARAILATAVGRKVQLRVPAAVVVDGAVEKAIPTPYKIAVKWQAPLPLPPLVAQSWEKRLVEVALPFDRDVADLKRRASGSRIASTRDYYNRQVKAVYEKRTNALRVERGDQSLWGPKAGVFIVGSDSELARHRAGEPLNGVGVIESVDFVPWLPVWSVQPLTYENWHKTGQLIVVVKLVQP